MPKKYLGTNPAVIDILASRLGESREDVEMVVFFLYKNDYLAVSSYYENKYRDQKGFSVSSLQRKIPQMLRRINSKLLDGFEMLDPELYDCPNNSLEPFFDKSVIGSIDTVPIRCWEMNNTYNPKYGHALKILLVTSNTGIILFTSEPYGAATHDLVIFKHCFLDKVPKDRSFLCDGTFTDKATAGIIVPYDGDAIWKDGPSQAHERLRFNEKIAHFRSRVEHRFSGVQMNRFGFINKKWRREITDLGAIVRLAAWVMNLEIFIRHGPKVGCYPLVCGLNQGAIDKLWKKFEKHSAMSSRYPEALAQAKAAKKEASKAMREASAAKKKAEKLQQKELLKIEKDRLKAGKLAAAAERRKQTARAKSKARRELAKGNAKRKVGGTNTTKHRRVP